MNLQLKYKHANNNILKSNAIKILILLLLAFIKPENYAADIELLIITPKEFEKYAQVLVEQKVRTPDFLNPCYIRLEDIYSNPYRSGRDHPEKIKYTIKYYIENYNTRFVLLLGDVDKFPVRWVNDGTYYFASDLYYADIYNQDGTFCSWDYNNNDYFGEHRLSNQPNRNIYSVNVDRADLHPDVAIGRIPASTSEEIESYVAKVIEYEQKTHGSSWYNNFLLAAGPGRKCDPAIHFNDIIKNSSNRYNFKVYINQSFFKDIDSLDYRPCDKLATESLEEYSNRTGLNKSQDSLLKEVKTYSRDTNKIPDYLFESLGLFGWHDHGIVIIKNYNTKVKNYGKYTIGYNDGCRDGAFVDQIHIDSFPDGPPPAILESTSPYNIDRAVPEKMLFAKNNKSLREAGWIAAVGATKKLSFPGNGEMMFRFFQSFRYPHATVAQSFQLGDMWRSMIEYWLDSICFDAGNHFDLSIMQEKYGVEIYDRSIHDPVYFKIYAHVYGLSQTMANTLFGDPSLFYGGLDLDANNDYTPPVTTDNSDDEWHGNDVTVTFTATDYGTASYTTGYRLTRYSIDNHDNWEIGSSVTIEAPDDHSNDGEHTIYYYSVDWAGNIEDEKSCKVYIETEPPVSSLLFNGELPITLLCACPINYDCGCPKKGCFTDQVEISMTASDNLSGIEGIYYYFEGTSYHHYAPNIYEAPFEKHGHDLLDAFKIHYWAVDGAGNQEEEKIVDFCVSNNFAGHLKDEMEILAALEQIVSFRASEELISPLPEIYEIDFEYALDEEIMQWDPIGTDNDGTDGWGINWHTEKHLNGNYFIRSTYYGLPVPFLNYGLEDTLLPIIHQDQFKVTVANIDSGSYQFLLQAPGNINQGGVIDYTIQLENNSEDDQIIESQVICKINPDLFDSIQVSDYGTINESGLPEWLIKLINPGEIWDAHVYAYVKKDIPPGTNIKAQAFLTDEDLAVLISDDPSTPETRDYTSVKVNTLNASITGFVKNILYLEPLEALISLKGMVNDTTFTDSLGNYIFKNLPAGEYSVSVFPYDSLYENMECENNASLEGMGENDTVVFYLENKDLKAPCSEITQTVDEILSEQNNEIKGVAYDYKPGRGVGSVQIKIRRLDDNKLWNGSQWNDNSNWLTVSGTDEWNYLNDSLTFDSTGSYIIQTKAIDLAGNEEIPNTFHIMNSVSVPESISPVDTFVLCGKTTFFWSNMYCDYYDIQVSENPDFSPLIIYEEQLNNPQYKHMEVLSDGIYYWRVKAYNIRHMNPELGIIESRWSSPAKFKKKCDQTEIIDVSTIQMENRVTVYPNPLKDYTNIYIQNNQAQNVQVQVFSTTGVLVSDLYREYSKPGIIEVKWKLNNLYKVNPGIYIIRATIGFKNYYTKCLVLNN